MLWEAVVRPPCSIRTRCLRFPRAGPERGRHICLGLCMAGPPGGRFFCSADPAPFRVALKGCKFLLPAVLRDLCNPLLSAVAPELCVFLILNRGGPVLARTWDWVALADLVIEVPGCPSEAPSGVCRRVRRVCASPAAARPLLLSSTRRRDLGGLPWFAQAVFSCSGNRASSQ